MKQKKCPLPEIQRIFPFQKLKKAAKTQLLASSATFLGRAARSERLLSHPIEVKATSRLRPETRGPFP
jgi:hypothetical protein